MGDEEFRVEEGVRRRMDWEGGREEDIK